MKPICYPLVAIFLTLFFPNSRAQNAVDVTIPITVTTTPTPSIILTWPTPAAGVTELVVLRKAIFETNWTLLAQLPTTATTFTDIGVGVGQAREYMILQNGGTPPQRIGLAYAGQDIPAFTGSRGKISLIVDNTLSGPLSAELTRFVQDLRGDGWQVVRHDVDPATSTVASIKALFRADYEADPANALAGLLFGNLPVPYSGNIAPDGHGDHLGAWPTDYYYGDMDEDAWTDNTVNNTVASRPANDNVPGDGKFDQSQTPTLAELIVSRVDFSNLSGWPVSQTELYRRYLNKNHAFRTGAYKPQNQTLVDDNFGYMGGEAFSQNGWRNGYAITGPTSVQAGDFFNDTDNQSFLIGHGCGGGSYTSANGVGNSDNFKTDSVNIVFSMLFGSYHGDWDFETNPFMPSALASKGGILTCSWAGRPNWHLHHMGLGEPIWVGTFWTWLNSFLPNPVYPPNFGADLIHVGLLGDPTLRAHAVRAPASAAATATCSGVTLAWAASPDAALGYYVYRAESLDSVFQLITPTPVAGTLFTDTAPLTGDNYYQIKSLKKEIVPTGSYFNQSIGAFALAAFTPPPNATAAADNVSCNGGTDGSVALTVAGGNLPLVFEWSNGSDEQNLTDVGAGTYTATVTDQLGCTAAATATVTEPPQIGWQTDIIDNISCSGAADGSAVALPNGGVPPFTYLWSNGATTQIAGNFGPGLHTVTLTDANGCSEVGSVTFNQPAPINITGLPVGALCNGSSSGSISLSVSGGTPGYAFAWSNGATTQNLNNISAGTYTVTATDNNGCTSTTSLTVTEPPELNLQTSVTNAACNGGTDGAVTLTVNGGSPGYTFLWSTGATTQNLTGVPAGIYSATVTDGMGCSNTVSAAVNQSSTLDAQANTAAVSCFGGADGSITLTVSGGTPAYTFEWSTGATTQNLSGLPPGGYTGTVTDANNCQQIVQATVGQPSQLVVGATAGATACFGGNDGSVTLTVSGGTPGYTFNWSNGATTQSLSGLPAGDYTGTVTDANNCQQIVQATVTEPTQLAVGITSGSASCSDSNDGSVTLGVSGGTPGYTFEWSNGATTQNLNNLPPGPYTGTVTDANGCAQTIGATVEAPDPLFINPESDEPTCYGGADGSLTMEVFGGTLPYSYLWSTGATTPTISGLSSGFYDGTATDGNGCTVSMQFVLTDPPPVVGELLPTFIPCFGDAAEIAVDNISGGAGAPYTYSVDNGPPLSPMIVMTIGAGSHTVQFYDQLGCSSEISLTITEPQPFLVGLVTTAVTCFGAADGSAAISVQGGTPPIGFQWSTGATTPTITGLSGGIYTVSVTDANGCTFIATATINEPAPLIADIVGSDTACIGFPEMYLLPDFFSNYNWETNGAGTVTQGQGTAHAEVTWQTAGANLLTATFTDPNGCPGTAELVVSADICTGAHEALFAGVTVLPNPFSGRLAVQFGRPVAPGTRLRLHDAQGRLILEKMLSAQEIFLETGALPAGAYWLHILENQKTGVWKIFKID